MASATVSRPGPPGPPRIRGRRPIADAGHALEVPDLSDDVAAEDDAAQVTGQRDDPVRDRHRERARVEEIPVHDHVLGDLPADLLVGPGEDAEHVGAAEGGW